MVFIGVSLQTQRDLMGYKWDIAINMCEFTLKTKGFNIENVDFHSPEKMNLTTTNVVFKGIEQSIQEGFNGFSWE